MKFCHKEEIGRYWVRICSVDETNWYVTVDYKESIITYGNVIGYRVDKIEEKHFKTRAEAEEYYKACLNLRKYD